MVSSCRQLPVLLTASSAPFRAHKAKFIISCHLPTPIFCIVFPISTLSQCPTGFVTPHGTTPRRKLRRSNRRRRSGASASGPPLCDASSPPSEPERRVPVQHAASLVSNSSQLCEPLDAPADIREASQPESTRPSVLSIRISCAHSTALPVSPMLSPPGRSFGKATAPCGCSRGRPASHAWHRSRRRGGRRGLPSEGSRVGLRGGENPRRVAAGALAVPATSCRLSPCAEC